MLVSLAIAAGMSGAPVFSTGAPAQPQIGRSPQETAACPGGNCAYEPGRILLKLAPPQSSLRTEAARRAWRSTTEARLAATPGVARLSRLFPSAVAPAPGAMLQADAGAPRPTPDLTRWYQADLQPSIDPVQVVAALQGATGVEHVELDYHFRLTGAQSRAVSSGAPPAPRSSSIPAGDRALIRAGDTRITVTDPLVSQQWHLAGAKIPEAWNYLESRGLPAGGDPGIVIAVIDSGVDYTHPDLAANMWRNPAETPANGIDDDGNGYVDDVFGADVITPAGDPMDDHGHGTHVAGIAAAAGNNGVGGVGVAFNAKIMALKAAQYSGVLAASDIAEAIQYATAKGADVINMSFGGPAQSQVVEDALVVAFGQAVLVAAAGNDWMPNEGGPCGIPRPNYPGAYNWVLGVMASMRSPGSNQSWLAAFSNFDCVARTIREYELAAPGVDVLSTLPGNQYAAWDGTSMATPVVAGLAALARTRWADRTQYSSRFIMGQVAGTLQESGVADGGRAVSTAPQPHLTFLRSWQFDSSHLNPVNDNDGRVDSGETIDLAVVIRNHWGKADQVTVKLEAWAAAAVAPDPYVTMLTDSVSYGAVGSFAEDDNGLLYDPGGVITGVQLPFRFTTRSDTPNEHVIPFKVTITARNGFDPADSTVFSFESRFTIAVQRGRELPNVIAADLTLTNDSLWIVPTPTLIPSGVTVRIEPGTKVQWGVPDPNAGTPYSTYQTAYLQVEGTLLAEGSAGEPIDFVPVELNPRQLEAVIYPVSGGRVELKYVRAQSPRFGANDALRPGSVDLIDHSDLSVSGTTAPPVVYAKRVTHTRIRPPTGPSFGLFQLTDVSTTLMDNVYAEGTVWFLGGGSVTDSVFLGPRTGRGPSDQPLPLTLYLSFVPPRTTLEEARADRKFHRNAILCGIWNPDSGFWTKVRPPRPDSRTSFYGAAENPRG